MAGLGSHDFGLHISLGAPGGCKISTVGDERAGGSAVLPTLCEGLKIELTHCEAEDTMLKGDCLG
jgi:hypothetical protein